MSGVKMKIITFKILGEFDVGIVKSHLYLWFHKNSIPFTPDTVTIDGKNATLTFSEDTLVMINLSFADLNMELNEAIYGKLYDFRIIDQPKYVRTYFSTTRVYPHPGFIKEQVVDALEKHHIKEPKGDSWFQTNLVEDMFYMCGVELPEEDVVILTVAYGSMVGFYESIFGDYYFTTKQMPNELLLVDVSN